MQIIGTFILIFSFGYIALANDCRTVQWPFSKNIKDIQPLSFQSIPRNHLYKYLYFEISAAPSARVKDLASKLFYYLKNTEQNEDKYQMIMALEWASDLQTAKPRIIPISEICTMEDKINREPSSKKIKRNKIIKKEK